MSVLPEYIFRAVIARGMRTLRQDTRLLDQLFRNLDQKSAQEMKDFILTNRLYLDINYPREDLKLPAIIILLRSETESQAYLGDSMGVNNVPNELTYDDYSDTDMELLGGVASVSTLAGQGQIVYGPAQVASATNNTLKISDSDWYTDQFRTEAHIVGIIAGTGAGQTRKISANGPAVLMVAKNWGANPDTTSVFEIRKEADEIIGEPSSIYTRQEARSIERLGSLYNLSYQIQIIGPNPELTVYLHAILKSIFTLSRQFLEKQGIINFRLGATDFVPRSEFHPDHVYMRAMNVDFQYPFDVFSQIEDIATSFRLALEGSPLEITLSDTEF